jgi:AcrR family transcriptional regulator
MAPTKGGIRQQLLQSIMEHLEAEGLGAASLRQIAAAVGTSHRMLVYHFGSKEALLVEVVRALEEQQKQFLAALVADASLAPGDQMSRMWRQLIDPSVWPRARLFFEVYGQALRGGRGSERFLKDVVRSWIGPLSELGRRHGIAEKEVESFARLSLAVTRGLLLDLLTSGDRGRIVATMDHFLRHYRLLAPSPNSRVRSGAKKQAGRGPGSAGRRRKSGKA